MFVCPTVPVPEPTGRRKQHLPGRTKGAACGPRAPFFAFDRHCITAVWMVGCSCSCAQCSSDGTLWKATDLIVPRCGREGPRAREATMSAVVFSPRSFCGTDAVCSRRRSILHYSNT